jgi:hypothetical protein
LRRFTQLLVACALAAGSVVAFAGVGHAQTGVGDLAAFCAGRIEANTAESKADNVEVLTKMVAAAPAAVSSPMNDLLALVKKKGDKAFESPQGTTLLGQIEPYIYDNCPGNKVPVTAIDYQYQGVPATLPAGVAKFKMTNAAPKEDHMMAIFKLTPEGAALGVDKVMALPQKKAGKYMDSSSQAFMEAKPGDTGYAPINLTPGTYAYACFFPQNGKKNGTLHFKLGMEGSFTVS